MTSENELEKTVKKLQKQIETILKHYKKLEDENEKLKEKVRAFYGT